MHEQSIHQVDTSSDICFFPKLSVQCRHSCVLEKCPFPSANANLSTGSSAKELHDSDVAEFPGGKVTASSTIKFAGGPGTTLERLPCYRALHSTGTPLEEAIIPHPIGPDLALKMHSTMVQLQVLDLIFYEAQRQVIL